MEGRGGVWRGRGDQNESTRRDSRTMMMMIDSQNEKEHRTNHVPPVMQISTCSTSS